MKGLSGKRVEIPSMEEITQERKRLSYRRRYKRVLKSTAYALVVVAAIAVLLASSAKRCNAKCAVRETVPPAMAAWNCGRVFSLCMQAPRLEPGGTNREQAGSRP